MTDPVPDPYQWPPTIELRRDPGSISRHLDALRALAAQPAPQVKRPTRGIVYVGGGRYWPGIAVGVRMLREAGCELPVQVWHRGDIEPVNAVDVHGMGVWIRDAAYHANIWGENRVISPNEFHGGWEAKLYALTHTCWDQVLFLDADAYCVADPTPLFDLLSPAEPFVFWHDMPHCENSVAWQRVWPAGKNGVPTVQGGQFLIDRRHGERLLNVAHWICQHSDYYFAHIYGDQDAWRVALAAGASGYRCLGAADWEQPAFICRHNGHPVIVHRCQSKLFADERPEPRDHLPYEGRVFSHFASVT